MIRENSTVPLDAEGKTLQSGFYMNISTLELAYIQKNTTSLSLSTDNSGEKSAISPEDIRYYRRVEVNQLRGLAEKARCHMEWLLSGLPGSTQSMAKR